MPAPKDVAIYIEHQPEEHQVMLQEIRALITAAVPKAEETISWNAPFYKYHGYLAGFAAYKKHVRFGIVGDSIPDDFRAKLEKKGYEVLERGVQIKYDQKVPTTELKQLLKAKAKLNESRT